MHKPVGRGRAIVVTRKHNIRIHALLMAMTTLGLLSALSPSAQAHSWPDWMKARWAAADRQVDWRFTTSFPTDNQFRYRVIDGSQAWNNVGEPMTFQYEALYPDYPSTMRFDCNDPYQANRVHWANIDNARGAQGQTEGCSEWEGDVSIFHSQMHTFQITFDSSEAWYTGTNASFPNNTAVYDPPNEGSSDLWSVAAHEFGHATGRPGPDDFLTTAPPDGDITGHFRETVATYCANKASVHHTMCSALISGTTFDRTLNTHDIDVFAGAYN